MSFSPAFIEHKVITRDNMEKFRCVNRNGIQFDTIPLDKAFDPVNEECAVFDGPFDNVLGYELINYRNIGMVLVHHPEQVNVVMFAIVNGEIKSYNAFVTLEEEGEVFSDRYGAVMAHVFCETTSRLWFFNFGSSYREKYGMIMKWMFTHNTAKQEYSRIVKDVHFVIQQRDLLIQDLHGKCIWHSNRVQRLQKTIFK